MKVLTVLISFLIVGFHPLHISVTDILMDEKDKRLEITMRVFVDDLEQTLRKNLNQPELDILHPQSGTIDDLTKAYIMKHLSVSIDQKIQTPIYLGHEVEDDAFIFYIEVPRIKKLKTINVRNDVLIDHFSDQSNLVNVTVGDQVLSMRLLAESSSDQLTFNQK